MHQPSAPIRVLPSRLTAQLGSVLMLAAGLCLLASPSQAALKIGAAAPDFTADAALAGQSFKFSLATALKKGPVVLYFYPKAFTSGCTVEAHEFAEATPRFEALGATVIGMSNDDLETLKKFSVEACRNKFAVAADPGARLTKAYDASLMLGMSDRITYVISPEGKVLQAFASMAPQEHVSVALKAVEAWRASPKR